MNVKMRHMIAYPLIIKFVLTQMAHMFATVKRDIAMSVTFVMVK